MQSPEPYAVAPLIGGLTICFYDKIIIPLFSPEFARQPQYQEQQSQRQQSEQRQQPAPLIVQYQTRFSNNSADINSIMILNDSQAKPAR